MLLCDNSGFRSRLCCVEFAAAKISSPKLTFSCAGFVGFAGSLTNPPILPDNAAMIVEELQTPDQDPGLWTTNSLSSVVRPPKSVLRSPSCEALLAKEGAFGEGVCF